MIESKDSNHVVIIGWLSLMDFASEMQKLPLKERKSLKVWVNERYGISECLRVKIKGKLESFDFSGLNLWDSDFSGVNLKGANFIGADLNHSDFNYTNLRNCIMGATTSVCWINFWGADFLGADIKKANFTLADTNNTNINKALFTS